MKGLVEAQLFRGGPDYVQDLLSHALVQPHSEVHFFTEVDFGLSIPNFYSSSLIRLLIQKDLVQYDSSGQTALLPMLDQFSRLQYLSFSFLFRHAITFSICHGYTACVCNAVFGHPSLQ